MSGGEYASDSDEKRVSLHHHKQTTLFAISTGTGYSFTLYG